MSGFTHNNFYSWFDTDVACSWLIFILCQDVIELFVRVLFSLTDNISKVKRVFPENEDDNDFKNEWNVGKQSDKSAKLELIATIFFILIGSAALNYKERYKVIDPAEGNEQDEATESLTRDRCWIVQNVDGHCGYRQTQEAVAFQHLNKSQKQEDVNDSLSDS